MNEKQYAIKMRKQLDHMDKYIDCFGAIEKIDQDKNLQKLNLDLLKEECKKLGVTMILAKDMTISKRMYMNEWKHGRGVVFTKHLL